MRVLGVDASTVRCGFALVKDDRKLAHLDELEFKSKIPHKDRRHSIANRVAELCERWHPDVVVLERIRLFHKGMIKFETIMRLCAVWTTISDASPVTCYTVPTQSWKKIAIGAGNATKEQTVQWVSSNYGKQVNHDVADAIGIGVAGLNYQLKAYKHLFRVLD